VSPSYPLQVPTRDFQVAIHLIYEDVGSTGYYSNVAFNGTIEVVERPKLVDFESIFMIIMIVGAVGGVGEAAAGLQESRVWGCCVRRCRVGCWGCDLICRLVQLQTQWGSLVRGFLVHKTWAAQLCCRVVYPSTTFSLPTTPPLPTSSHGALPEAASCCCLLLCCCLSLCCAAVYWGIANSSDKLGVKKAAKRSKKGEGKAAAFDEDEWIKDTPYHAAQQKKLKSASTKQA
jgi:hypothetical protein